MITIGPVKINTQDKTVKLNYEILERQLNIAKTSARVILKYWLKTNATTTYVRKTINEDFDNLAYLNTGREANEATREEIGAVINDNSPEANIETLCEITIPPLCRTYARYKTSKVIHNLFTGNAKKDKRFYLTQLASTVFEIVRIFWNDTAYHKLNQYYDKKVYPDKIEPASTIES